MGTAVIVRGETWKKRPQCCPDGASSRCRHRGPDEDVKNTKNFKTSGDHEVKESPVGKARR